MSTDASGGPKGFEQLMELIKAHPQSAELSISFRKVYLEALIVDCGSPKAALKRLVICLKAHKDLSEMEQKMLVPPLHLLTPSLRICYAYALEDSRV